MIKNGFRGKNTDIECNHKYNSVMVLQVYNKWTVWLLGFSKGTELIEIELMNEWMCMWDRRVGRGTGRGEERERFISMAYRCGLGSLTMTISWWKAQESAVVWPWNCFLSSPDLVLDSLRIPRELLVFSLHGHPGELVLMPVKQCFRSRTDELTTESEGKQAKS